MNIHPLPEWAWGNGLSQEAVTDLIDAADTCNEACLLADEAQLIYRRSGVRLHPERELGRPAQYYIDMLAGWNPSAADYCGRLLTVYVQIAAKFAVNTVSVAEALTKGSKAEQASTLADTELSRFLQREAADIAQVQVGSGWPKVGKPLMDTETRQRVDAELVHDHQQLVSAIEAFGNRRQRAYSDYSSQTIPSTSRIWIEVDGPALGTRFHSYAANCLWLIANLTSATR